MPRAIDEHLSGGSSYDDAMDRYQATRDEHVLAMFDFTLQLASLEPPPAELQQLLMAVHGNQQAMDGFARVNAGVTSPAEFFSEENVAGIFAAASRLTGDPFDSSSPTETAGVAACHPLDVTVVVLGGPIDRTELDPSFVIGSLPPRRRPTRGARGSNVDRPRPPEDPRSSRPHAWQYSKRPRRTLVTAPQRRPDAAAGRRPGRLTILP